MIEDAADHPRLLGGRDGDVDHFDLGVVEQRFERGEDAWHPAQRGDLARRGLGPRGQAHDLEAGVGVGDEVAVADDEARPDHADPDVAAAGHRGQVAQIRVHAAGGVVHRPPTTVKGFSGKPFRPYGTGSCGRVQGAVALRRAGFGSPSGQGWNQRSNSSETVCRVTVLAARPKASAGASTAMMPTPPRQSISQSGGATSASDRQGRQADQDDMGLARLVRGPGERGPASARPGGRRRRPAAAGPVDPEGAGLALQALEERLVAAVVVQAEHGPAQRDREPGRRPAQVAGPRGQAVAEAESQAEVRRVVHQVVEIDAVEARRPAPAGDLAIDVIEPERQVRQHDAGHEPRARTRHERQRRRTARRQRQERHLVGREAEPDRQPGPVDRRSAARPAAPASCRSHGTAPSGRSTAASARVGCG